MRIRLFHGAVLSGLLLSGCAIDDALAGKRLARLNGPKPTFALQAADFRYEQRGQMPPNALIEAKAQRERMLAGPRPAAAGIWPASWAWIGPGLVGGRLRAILIHPTQPTTMWVGTAGGGIWKTLDGGANWQALDEFMPSLSIGSMALSPSNPDVLYAGTGEGFFETVEGSSNTAAIRGAGVFKSTDGGSTWQQLPSTASWFFTNRIAVHPSNGAVVWAATSAGIFKSNDGGVTWTSKAAGNFFDLKVSPSDPLKLIAAKSHTGPYYSNDGGETWTASTGVAGDRVELAYAQSAPGTVYASQSSGGVIKLYRSTNGGQTFSLRTSGSGISTYESYNNTLWVDPTNSSRVIVGGVFLYRSTDGGTTLARVFNGVHADMHAIATHPGYNGSSNRTIYIGCDGGIYRIPDATGTSSARINNNLGVTQFYGAAISDASGTVVAGAQDNGTNTYTGNAMAWSENVIGGDGTYAAADQSNPAYFYGGYQWMSLYRSSDGGSTFSTSVAPPGSGSSNNYNFIPYFMLDPNEQNRMYACGELLWRSNNIRTGNPPTWTSVKPSIRDGGKGGLSKPPGAHMVDNNPWNISTVAVAQGNSDIVWVGHNNGNIYKSTNGTSGTPTWTRVDQNPGPLPDRWVSRIVISPSDPNIVYVSLMGWASDNVWKTSDGGITWQPIVGSGPSGLPAAPVGALALHQTKPGWLYAGTDVGIFTSSDDGQTWTTGSDGPSTTPIDELVWRNASVLMAVTHGRGIYLATISTAEEPFAPRSFSISPGQLVAGRLQELYFNDDRTLTARVGVARSRRSVGAITLEGVAPVGDGASLELTIRAMGSLASFEAQVDFFDFSTGLWVRAADAQMGQTEAQITASAPGGAAFIQPGTRLVRSRVSFVSLIPSGNSWTFTLDQAYWKLRL